MAKKKKKKLPLHHLAIAGVSYALLFWGAASDITGTDSDNKCGGDELWEQKVLIDDSAVRIRKTPQVTTIVDLININTEDEQRTKEHPRLSFEYQEVTVKNVLIRKVIREDDNDYHLVIQDRAGNHMIAEIADPKCDDAKRSQFIDQFSDVRQKMDDYGETFLQYEFNITGVLFRDRSHGQTGKSDNNLEIHPVLKLRKVKKIKI